MSSPLATTCKVKASSSHDPHAANLPLRLADLSSQETDDANNAGPALDDDHNSQMSVNHSTTSSKAITIRDKNNTVTKVTKSTKARKNTGRKAPARIKVTQGIRKLQADLAEALADIGQLRDLIATCDRFIEAGRVQWQQEKGKAEETLQRDVDWIERCHGQVASLTTKLAE